MGLLKMKEIRSWSAEDRQRRLKDLRDDLMRERGTASMGGAPISPGKIRAIRTNIARILTFEQSLKTDKIAGKKIKQNVRGRN